MNQNFFLPRPESRPIIYAYEDCEAPSGDSDGHKPCLNFYVDYVAD